MAISGIAIRRTKRERGGRGVSCGVISPLLGEGLIGSLIAAAPAALVYNFGDLPNNSGSLAIFAAILHASSRVGNLAADRRHGSFSK